MVCKLNDGVVKVIPMQTQRALLGKQRHCTDPGAMLGKLAESALNLATLECSKVKIKVQRNV